MVILWIFRSLPVQFEHSLGLGGETPSLFALCMAHSLQFKNSGDSTMQSFPTMCNHTFCAQVLELS